MKVPRHIQRGRLASMEILSGFLRLSMNQFAACSIPVFLRQWQWPDCFQNSLERRDQKGRPGNSHSAHKSLEVGQIRDDEELVQEKRAWNTPLKVGCGARVEWT